MAIVATEMSPIDVEQGLLAFIWLALGDEKIIPNYVICTSK